jgi:hypothetical protein
MEEDEVRACFPLVTETTALLEKADREAVESELLRNHTTAVGSVMVVVEDDEVVVVILLWRTRHEDVTTARVAAQDVNAMMALITTDFDQPY